MKHPYFPILVIVVCAFLVVLAIALPAQHVAKRQCATLAQKAGVRYWVVGDRLQCLGSDDNQRWVVLR